MTSTSAQAKRKRFMAVGLGFVMLLTGLACDPALAQSCEGCDDAFQIWACTVPFEGSQREFRPTTMGLPVGAPAPEIDGVELRGKRTVLCVCNGYVSERLMVFAETVTIEGLQVVVVLAGLNASDEAKARDWAGRQATIVEDPLATVVCALYRVGSGPGVFQCTFLIDESQQIVYRKLGNVEWVAAQDAALARVFAATGRIPEGTDLQHVLWYGDSIPWPEWTIETYDGVDVAFPDGTPTLIYYNISTGSGEPGSASAEIFAELDALRSEFPEVRFIWLFKCISSDAVADNWSIYRRTGLAARHPEWYALPLEEFVELNRQHLDSGYVEEIETIQRGGAGWELWFDPDGRLASFWSMLLAGSLLIIDADGEVIFPVTAYPINGIGGTWRAHPDALDELRGILAALMVAE